MIIIIIIFKPVLVCYETSGGNNRLYLLEYWVIETVWQYSKRYKERTKTQIKDSTIHVYFYQKYIYKRLTM